MKKFTLSTVMNYDKGDGFAKILSLNNSTSSVSFSLVNAWDAIVDVYQQGLHTTNSARHFKYAISWSSLHELKIVQLDDDFSNEDVDTILAQVSTTNGVDLYVSSLYNGESWIKTRVEVTAFSNQGQWLDGSEFVDISSLNPTYCKSCRKNNLSGYHNSIYRGKDLTDKYTIEELEEKIGAGDFSDLYIGDYITKSTTVNGVAENVDYVIAGFDYMNGIGNVGIGMTAHHAVIVTRNTFNTAIKMEDSATTANGYYGSKAHGSATGTSSNAGLTNITVEYDTFQNSILGTTGSYTFTFNGTNWTYDTYTYTPSQLASVYGISYSGTAANTDTLTVTFTEGYLEPMRKGIYDVFGKSHCLSYKDFLTTGTTAGAWKTARVELMNECLVYGTKLFANDSGGEKTKYVQLPLFSLRPEARVTRTTGTQNRTNYWLSSISSASSFCAFGSYGNPDYRQANQSINPRVFFLLG